MLPITETAAVWVFSSDLCRKGPASADILGNDGQMSASQSDIDLTNLPRFLSHLGDPERDAASAGFAKKLIDDGGEITGFSGPEQMDVWELIVRRGGRLVRFGVERGYSDGALVRPADDTAHASRSVPVKLVVLGWARAMGVGLALDDPIAFRVDLLAHGTTALDWLDQGNDDVVMRIAAAPRSTE